MQGCIGRWISSCLIVIFLASNSAVAEIPATWIEDAQLNDVQTVGLKHAFAVGEHGAIWKTEDGGRKWSRLECGLDVSLRSACFLTDQVGWIAGCDVNPYSGSDGGVLLATQDGGRTWKRLGRESLPTLSYVKFFDMSEGVVVGQPTSLSPSGIFKTTNSGQTWRGVHGETPQAWKAMSFFELEKGAVAGVNGRVSLMGGDQLFESKLTSKGFRSIRAISVSSSNVGWLAGDGGLVLKTSNGGIVWESPATQLPDELRVGMDFHAVEVRDEKVWLAGSPGSVIWHSPDGGQHWAKQMTGQSTPLSALRFSNEQTGIAVGALGVIVRTEDGGTTWQTIRGDGRRAAVLSLHARPSQTSAPLLAKLSGELGYRSAVWIAQRDDLGPLALSTDSESRLQTAVQKCGGNASDIHWQLPITVPGLEYSSSKLTAEWQRQTEGRLSQTMSGVLVRQIRTWRPNIVVIDQPSPDDAACQLLYDTVQNAIGQAADPTRFTEQSNVTGLALWSVDRVYMRLAPGAIGDAHVELDEFLPYLKSSTRIVAGTSIALLQAGRIPVSETIETPRIAYRLLGTDEKSGRDSSATRRGVSPSGIRSGDFFNGLSIQPGSAARREMGTLDEATLEQTQKLIQKQRNFTAYSQKSLDDPRVAGQMLGQLRGVVDGMNPQQAAGLLRDLADEYRKRSQFENVEATYQELIHLYPKEPASLDAMRWLIQFWCSSETAWQRSREIKSQVSVSQTNPIQAANFVQQGESQTLLTDDGVNTAVGTRQGADVIRNSNSGAPNRLTAKFNFDSKPASGKKKNKSEQLKVTADVDSRTGAISEWQSRAMELAKQLETLSPALFRSPEIQFPLAALRRTRGSARAADAIVRNFLSNSVDVGTKQLAERELWTSFASAESPQSLAYCRRVTQRPHLDGLLSDPCWEDAAEIRLTEKPVSSTRDSGSSESTATLLMLAYDNEFLYVGFSVPRAAGAPRDNPQLAGRKHDADLTRHDRISIRLDIDRDYATWYEFQVDQRGWTSESCWEDRRWDPQWYVAAEGDETAWRVEAAIPWGDLTPAPPQPGTFYGISILRTIPTVGLQSWTQPATARAQPSSFGLVKFE